MTTAIITAPLWVPVLLFLVLATLQLGPILLWLLWQLARDYFKRTEANA